MAPRSLQIYDCMSSTLSSPRPRRLFFAAATIVSIVVLWQASELWLADYWIESGNPSEMAKSAAFTPGNADAWDRLGRYHLLSFSDPNIPLATQEFQKAVEIDSLSQDYWMDLASAYDASGDEAGAEKAYAEARNAYPTSALVDWNYGNFLLREGKDQQGYEEIAHAVRGTPTLLPLAMSRVWHSSGDVNELLDHVIPPDEGSYITALNFFGSIKQAQPGIAVWQRLVSLGKPVNLPALFDFMEELIRENDSDDAVRIWNGSVASAGEPQLAVSAASPVSDGAFQSSFPDGGLGWRWQSELGASIDFDSSTPNGKGRSVRLDFSGGVNVDVTEPMQYVAIQSGQAYHFHASMRTEGITTDSGMRIVISDVLEGNSNVQSASFIGTHPWTDIDLDIPPWPQTHFLVIQLRRDQSKYFDNKLGGSVWIADVSLVPATASVSRAPQ